MGDATLASALTRTYTDAVRRIIGRPAVPLTQKNLLVNGKYADMMMYCGGKYWLAHRAIIGTQSSVFSDSIDACVRNGRPVVVHLSHDDRPEILARLLQFLYTGDCT
ncbi:hypothetical protein B0I35DRAFT_472921 [Stachybotrys elegans]|uniref:BTB domain-containing protein n=1 Tax=Stachybotrys elegans TaxID=80388 RepID=A0A8K0T0U2_9HYPO|nr:hypothetical protein B0I35DRAFT_472921 [Stachybotrys elegans]